MSENAGISSPAPSTLPPPLLGPAVSRRAVGPTTTGSDHADDAATAAAFQRVAERLEAIAASLRRATPGELPVRGDAAMDPLEVLITGYALGLSQALQPDEPAPGAAT